MLQHTSSVRAVDAMHPFQQAASEYGVSKSLFASPPAAGRKITAGFSFLQRIGKAASIDVWFPGELQQQLDQLLVRGGQLGPDHFPAEWAAVRQFELLQDAGNYKIYDMRADYITRSLHELTRSMRGGGYRVTVATLGSYTSELEKDDLEILDQRLQKRLSHLIHMLYLEEQSAAINQKMSEALINGSWDYNSALPHVGVTLGARDLFRPVDATVWQTKANIVIPRFPHIYHTSSLKGWVHGLGVQDSDYNQPFVCVGRKPEAGEYRIQHGAYQFAQADAGREVTLSYMHNAQGCGEPRKLSPTERKHKLARQFFSILDELPNKHIVHDTAVGLQLPECIGENEWIYVTAGDESFGAFNRLLTDLFTPFDGISMGALDGRADAGSEIKSCAQHLRGHGDRLTPDAEQFYRSLAQFAPH